MEGPGDGCGGDWVRTVFCLWGDVTWIYFCCGSNGLRSPASRPRLDRGGEKHPVSTAAGAGSGKTKGAV